MDWIHCNHCYTLRSENNESFPFFMTSCGHIFCGRCTDGSTQKCLIQNNDCTYALLSVVQRDREVLFANPTISLQTNARAIGFQLSQYISLINYLKGKLTKYNAQKQEIINLKSECKRHREEKNNLKNELIQRHEDIRLLKKQVESCQMQLNSQRKTITDNRSDTQRREPLGSSYLFGAATNVSQLSFSPLARGSSEVFTPPKPVPFPKSYRDANVYNPSTPQRKSTLASPPSFDYAQRPTRRNVMLPGDKGSSPINRIGLQRLNLKCTPSFDRARAPRIGVHNSTSKYNKYF